MTNPYIAAMEYLIDAGVTQAYANAPNNRFENAITSIPAVNSAKAGDYGNETTMDCGLRHNDVHKIKPHADIIKEAETLAAACKNLEELKAAIQNFDGLTVKKNATQIVFADGNQNAKIMVIGEAPGADEDRQGLPFVGVSGQLLDKIFACINVSRAESLYISNILNWRPPGNRTPTTEEMDIACPFIKRHIELVSPDILVLCGGVAAQTLLQSKDSISRLRGKVHHYSDTIKAIATYHPAFLLRTPLQKKKVWEDMLMLQEVLGG